MEKIYDETFKHGKQASRNIWYKDCKFTKKSSYGVNIDLKKEYQKNILQEIKKVLSQSTENTSFLFYFYARDISEDALGENIRPSIMIRTSFDRKDVDVQVNMSDYDFASNLDNILREKQDLENLIKK